MSSLFEFLFNFHRYLIAISISSQRTTRRQAMMHLNTSLLVSTHTWALQCTLYTISVTSWFRNDLETFILSMPLPLCSSGLICKSMLFTGQCQLDPRIKGGKVSEGLIKGGLDCDAGAEDLSRRGRGFVRWGAIRFLRWESALTHTAGASLWCHHQFISHFIFAPTLALLIIKNHLGRSLTSHNHGNTSRVR